MAEDYEYENESAGKGVVFMRSFDVVKHTNL